MFYQDVPIQGEVSRDSREVANRRASIRYQCRPATPGRVVLFEKQEFVQAWVLDLSKQGVGLLLPRPLAAGQLLHVQMKNVANQPYELTARVAHCTQKPTNDWVAGCELVSQLSADELDALLL